MQPLNYFLRLSLILCVGLIGSLSAAGLPAVEYRVAITEPAHQYADVTVFYPETEKEYLDISMPVWRLGRYQILNLANGLRHVKASDSRGKSLPIQKINKHTWRITLDEATKVVVSYQLYANQLQYRARHIDDTHAYLDGVSTFVYAQDFIEHPITIRLDVPKGWNSHSGMERTGRHRFKADNYDVLASSPIETGFHEYYEFQANGKDYELVIWGKGNYDSERILKDYQQMVVSHGEMWGSYPFQRYLFIIHATEGVRGATEHINSTIIQRDAMGFDDAKEYAQFLSTSSHEFVHTWNVKAYRPVGLNDYNYLEENYSDLLWISEGSTDYLADLLLARAGLIKTQKYLDILAKQLYTYYRHPGKEVMSAQQASFDAWIESGGHRAENDGVSIYTQGVILSFFKDLLLITDSNGASSLGDLHRILYERFPVPDKGFSAADIQRIMQELSGIDYSEMWAKYMDGTETIAFDPLLEQLGLQYLPQGKKDKEPKLIIDAGLEFVTKTSNKLKLVRRNSPAWQAGLTVDDQIVAVNGMRLVPGQWQDLMSTFKNNDEVRVSYFRRNVLKETALKTRFKSNAKATLKPIQNPTEQQKKNFEKWLGLSWPKAKATTEQ